MKAMKRELLSVVGIVAVIALGLCGIILLTILMTDAVRDIALYIDTHGLRTIFLRLWEGKP